MKKFMYVVFAVCLFGLPCVCAPNQVWAAENVFFSQDEQTVRLKQYPGYSVTRGAKGIIRTVSGRTYTLAKAGGVYRSSHSQWPDVIAHDFDYDGEPEFLVLGKATETDALYYLKHRQHGQGQANYLFSHWQDYQFVNPVFDEKKRTITSSTSLGCGITYAWIKGADKRRGFQYAEGRMEYPGPRPLSEREIKRASFFSVDEKGTAVIPYTGYIIPGRAPLRLMPGAPLADNAPEHAPGRGFSSVFIPVQYFLRVTPDHLWVHVNMDHFHGFLPVSLLFLETREAVTLLGIPTGEGGTAANGAVTLQAETPVLLFGVKKDEQGRDWCQVMSAAGLKGWTEAGRLAPCRP